MTTLQGEQIVLRPYRLEDAETILQGANDPELRRLTGTQMTFTLEQTRKYVERTIDGGDEERFARIIADPATLEPLGEVILMDIDPDNRNAALRIAMFSTEQVGKGYGTEALRLILDYGFRELNLHRVALDVFAFNPRAIRAYEKVGFKKEGVDRDALFYEGKFHDSVRMGILEDEWRAMHG